MTHLKLEPRVLAELRAEAKRRLAKAREDRKLVRPDPLPRYDEVFYFGIPEI